MENFILPLCLYVYFFSSIFHYPLALDFSQYASVVSVNLALYLISVPSLSVCSAYFSACVSPSLFLYHVLFSFKLRRQTLRLLVLKLFRTHTHAHASYRSWYRENIVWC